MKLRTEEVLLLSIIVGSFDALHGLELSDLHEDVAIMIANIMDKNSVIPNGIIGYEAWEIGILVNISLISRRMRGVRFNSVGCSMAPHFQHNLLNRPSFRSFDF